MGSERGNAAELPRVAVGHFLLPFMVNCMTTLPLLLVLCAVSSASAQQFTVNVDCGTTGKAIGDLQNLWVGDEEYVKSGQSATVRIDNSLTPPLATLRYFPSGKKNCYSFPGIGAGNKILVRAYFYYGNYDELDSPPTFNVLFNGNLWATVSFSSQNIYISPEMVHMTKVDDVSVCLARTKPNDVPFINSLEIKQLEGDMYASMDADRPLHLRSRYAYGLPLPSTSIVMGTVDGYNRIWSTFTGYANSGLKPVSWRSDSSNPISNLLDQPPLAVLRQAITPSLSEASNLTIPIPFPTLVAWTSPVPHYVTFYFVEMLPDANRSFDFYLDDQKIFSETIVPSETAKEIINARCLLSMSSVFSLVKTNGSTLPPLISAAELFQVGNVWGTAATDSSDVKALSKLQNTYVQLRAWSGDPCLPIGYAWEWVNCTAAPAPRVNALYLSGYGLTGPLADFSELDALQTIDLHNNSLSGSVPESLGQLPDLTQLNLADNLFNGPLPASLTSNSMLKLNVSGNDISDSSKKTNVGVVAGAAIGSLFFLLLLVIIAMFIFKKRHGNAVRRNPSADNAQPTSVLLDPEVKHGFSHAEIVEITNNFEKVIGKGGSGNVYYGQLKNGCEVAVKVLKDSFSEGAKAFVAEVKLLMTVHHKFLVSFVGYCEESGNLILLYEYMSGGNLRQLLSDGSSMHAIQTWEGRLRVALSVATGLDYLHSGCSPSIIHRDVKTTNILLNGKMEAKVADFGLSKAGKKDDVTQLSTLVAGTPGYIDPEYYNTSLVTKKSDVYSFGVVLFELITGRPPLFDVSEKRFHIVQWATASLVRGDIDGIADPKLKGQYNVNSMWKVADIAMSCTSQSSHSRPHMSDVVDQLKEAMEVETGYQQRTDTSFTEVQLSSSSSYEVSSSFPSYSLRPPAR